MYANLHPSTEGQKVTCDRQPYFTYPPSEKEVSLEEVSLEYLPKEEGTPEPSSALTIEYFVALIETFLSP